MSRQPSIGIPTYPPGADGRFFLATEYVHAVHRAGGLPILFPPVADHAAQWLDHVDALLVPGGGDVDPARYGAPRGEMVYGVNPLRDTVELALVRAAFERRVPMLLICRGMQVLNVALGGTLHAHIPDAFGESTVHRGPERAPTTHDVHVVSGTRLARILGTDTVPVTSLHHQAVDRLAPGLRPGAYAPDGVMEACEAPDRWVVAVQWHPECTADQDPVQRRLFEALIGEAAGRTRAAAE